MQTAETIKRELHEKRGTPMECLNRMTLYEIDGMYQKQQRREREELYLSIRCDHTFYNKEKKQQECRLKPGKLCKWSKDLVFSFGCKKYLKTL